MASGSNATGPSVGGDKPQDVVATPCNADRLQMVAAGTTIGPDYDGVAKIIPDDRLNLVREVGQQHSV